MKAVIPYIIAMFAGLFARTIAASLGGIDYTMDGHDFLMMILAIIAVWSFKADRKNGAEDIKKAEWYEDYLMKLEDSNDKD